MSCNCGAPSKRSVKIRSTSMTQEDLEQTKKAVDKGHVRFDKMLGFVANRSFRTRGHKANGFISGEMKR